MDKLRLSFKKTGRAAYISHLDLMRVMQRSFDRAGVKLRYSEGFNPHALISICLPMSVGVESVCELMDFRVAEDYDLDELPGRLSAAMPGGIAVREVWEPEKKITELKWLRVQGNFEYDSRESGEMAAALGGFFAGDELPVTRRTKRGEGVMDLKPNIREISFLAEGGAVRTDCVISAQEPTVNPDLLCAVLVQRAPEIAPDFAKFKRRGVYDGEMNIFR